MKELGLPSTKLKAVETIGTPSMNGNEINFMGKIR
jgi:hypothetical protein